MKNQLNLIRITTLIKNHEYAFSFLIILLVVTVSNLHSVFGLDILLLDDNARYFFFNRENYAISVSPRTFIGTGLLLKWITVTIYSTYSLELARLFTLLIYMIPVSCLFYVFNRKYLHLSMWVSLSASVIINIIPQQYAMPTFLDGSYPVPGMFIFLATLIVATLYLKSPRTSVLLLVSASLGWLLVCDNINEVCIFLYPVFLYYVYTTEAESKRKYYLYFITFITTAYRIYFYMQAVGVNATNKPTSLSIEKIASRIVDSIQWWLPFKSSASTTVILGCIIILIIFNAYFKKRNTEHKEKIITRAYIFYGLWFFLVSAPFWFITKYFSARYFYISYFALTTITLIAIFQIFILSRKHKNIISVISLAIIFSVYGTQRYLINANKFDYWNRKNSNIYSLLKNEKINDDTQIALVNIKNGTGGYYVWSSGYLQYLLKKPSIRGLMGNEFNFYDPFNLKHCSYTYTMSCIDSNKKLIAYKQNAEFKKMRMRYFLQWISKGKRDSQWIIYKTDKDNKLSITKTGAGIDDYIETLYKLNLEPEDVLWGDYSDKKSLNKLL